MKVKEELKQLRLMGDEKLMTELVKTRKEYLDFSLSSTQRAKQANKGKLLRKKIARIETVISQKISEKLGENDGN
ncbi:50S ribosomal protein L29 [Candidatus Berkelbacteria bacterium CG10_big_fil_rev_8_21_14_0_10_41_12]|uniref:Large ribosomal subunit protein uL29 n=1 Tax=Candidatus Berkelbacteria bacterium CG10_big_fil_rev_8_21_14_0_10_41_12 TaxID=1974513 RepID=A0A2M6WXV4_9BACT|nr:MAG: 50S ribosomal protein L29 [Candidatus Berkelbacteria bacterium CG10_big_fil_rev_8_21_14_0_10_41_12]